MMIPFKIDTRTEPREVKLPLSVAGSYKMPSARLPAVVVVAAQEECHQAPSPADMKLLTRREARTRTVVTTCCWLCVSPTPPHPCAHGRGQPGSRPPAHCDCGYPPSPPGC